MLKYGTGTQAKFDSVNKGLKGSRELERVAASGEFSAGHTFVPSERAAPLCNCAGWVAKAGICSFRILSYVYCRGLYYHKISRKISDCY